MQDQSPTTIAMSAPPTASRPAAHTRDARALIGYLAVLVGRESGALLEIRARSARGMSQRFHSSATLRTAARDLLQLGWHTDVYVGCIPRRRRAGGRDALERGWVLWADCDDPAALEALAAFEPRPSIIVRSGSATNAHAYWPLLRPITVDALAEANRRIAAMLGADLRSAEAARILRPPGTWNFKHDPPRPVTVERFKPARRYALAELVDQLPDPPEPQRSGAPVVAASGRDGDPLLAITPAVYVGALTGLAVGRDGKIACPFHSDRTPSLHVYERPDQGWTCFGCGRGGSIYDLAAELEGITPRGRDFIALRQRLHDRFGIATEREPDP